MNVIAGCSWWRQALKSSWVIEEIKKGKGMGGEREW